jgi:hypothetical protein
VETVRGLEARGPYRPTLPEVPRQGLQPGRHKERAGDALDRPRTPDHHQSERAGRLEAFSYQLSAVS